MKVSKARFLYLLSAIVFSLGILSIVYFWKGARFCDIRLRYNEICCVHKGINPFFVWSGKSQCEGFVGYPRPDMKASITSLGRQVHAYPAWHYTYFWWLPSFSFFTVVIGYTVLSIVLVAGLFVWLYKIRPKDSSSIPYYFCALSSIAFYYPWTYIYGNYGIILAVSLTLFLWCYEKKHDCLAGIVWAFMMIKPQVSVLFAIPILLQRRYRVLIVAMVICFLALLPPAFKFCESPIDLILQIPEIGRPYIGEGRTGCGHVLRALFNLFGYVGVLLWSVVIVGTAFFGVYRLRKNTSAFVVFAPIVAAIPIWNYSQCGDSSVLWVPVVALYAVVISELAQKAVKIASVFLSVASLFMLLWSYSTVLFNFFSPTGLGWIYAFVHLAYYFVLFGAVIYVSCVAKRV